MKPSHLMYGVDEQPPRWISLVLGIQHVCIISISFIFPVIVVRYMNGTPSQAAAMVSLSMLAGGIGTMAQALNKGPVGSGYLCPQVSGPSYLAASMLAVRTGGLSLVCGMVLVAGIGEALFSRLIKRLRALFPAEVVGFIVTMVGITLIPMAGKYTLGLGDIPHHQRGEAMIVAFFTLTVMVGLNVWGKGRFKLFCILFGMGAGYALSWVVGILNQTHLEQVLGAPLLHFPLRYHPGFSFDLTLLAPFFVAMLCSSLKSVGDLTTCQKINDRNWKRPDMGNISRGILADAVGGMSAGVLGGFGQSTSSTNVGLTIATGVTSRSVAWVTGGLLVVFSFVPKLSAVFAVMPPPVMGATLVFSLCFMVMAGLQIIMSRMLDARKTFVVGLSLTIGLLVDLLPEAFADVPSYLQPMFESSLSAATVSALILNFVFRLGISKKAALHVDLDQPFAEPVFTFFESQGRAWGARREIIQKARGAAHEMLEAASGAGLTDAVDIELGFDELKLVLRVSYHGEPLRLPKEKPRVDDVLEKPEGVCLLAGYLIRQYSDNIYTHKKGERTIIDMWFEH